MITREQLLDALKHIPNSEYGKSIIELNLVRDIMIKEDQISLRVVLTSEQEDVKTKLHEQISMALKQAGVTDLHIRFRQISDSERNDLINPSKKGQAGSQHAHAQSQARGQGVSPILSADSKVQFIAVASGKGGVGKSTVTVNLAVALARKGNKVGIIDADIYGFSVPDMMGIEEQPKMVDKTIIPVEKYGVKVISMGFFVQDNAPIVWRGPMLGKMLRNFFSEVSWGELDYLLLDLPPGTGDIALDVHQMIPHSKEVIVTTPHATAAFVAARAGAMAVQTNHEILGIVENMAYYECPKCGEKDYIFGHGGGAKLAEELHTELLAQIPLGAPDNHISEKEYSPSVYKEDSAAGRIFSEIAERIMDKVKVNV